MGDWVLRQRVHREVGGVDHHDLLVAAVLTDDLTVSDVMLTRSRVLDLAPEHRETLPHLNNNVRHPTLTPYVRPPGNGPYRALGNRCEYQRAGLSGVQRAVEGAAASDRKSCSRTAVYDATMRLRPMLQVSDVVVASRWYQDALGLTSGHGGEEFEMLFSGDHLVLQLHRLDAHEHGFPQPVKSDVRGAGVSLWFETSDRSTFDAMFERAESSGASIVERPHWNPLAHHHEATMIDAEGYIVVIHSPFEPDV